MPLPKVQLTQAGLELLAKTPLGTDIPVLKWQIGSGALADAEEGKNRTQLLEPVMDIPIASKTVNGNSCLITGQFTNTTVTQEFKWEETGLTAADPDVGEILFGYGNSLGDGEPIPIGTSDLREIIFGAQFIFDITDNLHVEINEGLIFATVAQLNQKISLTEKGQPGGVATLDEEGAVPMDQIPAEAILEPVPNLIEAHNTSETAHQDIRNEMEGIDSRLSLMELLYNTEITGNPFIVTFENLNGLTAEGVHNTVQKRMEF